MSEFSIAFPITMVKKEERIVTGIATADNVDKVGDIVDFSASEIAFKNWAGNIREMHSPIAVGKAIAYKPIKINNEEGDEFNAIEISAYISKGAQSTWEKVLDGTLKAFSIGGRIIKKEMMEGKMHNGRQMHVIKEYELGELSLVDNPANALAVINLIKRTENGGLEYALKCCGDICEYVPVEKKQPIKDPRGGLTAAGRRHFKQTEGANLKPGVRGAANTPEKMRRKGSFLTRFFTNPSGPMKKPNGKPTRLALSAAAWGEPVPQDRSDAARLAAKGRRLLERYARTKEKADFENSFEDDLSFDDALLQQIVSILKNGEFPCNCEECECGAMEKDASVTTQNATSKSPARSGFISPTMPKPLKNKKNKVVKKTNDNLLHEENHFDIIKEMIKDMESIIQQDPELQINNTYDMLSDMNEQENGKLNLLKKFVSWLVPDVAEENASTSVEVDENTQEEDMDINVLKDALSAVVDEKLASFATSIKEEVEAAVQEKIDTVSKGFEVQNSELQEKLNAAEIALAEQTEKVAVISAAGAAKKSVDPEGEEDAEILTKTSAPSFWKNTYLPQELINSLGYQS